MPRKPPARVIVVTGASNGIGRALALEFALAGDALVLGSRREVQLETVRRDCEALHAMTIAKVTNLAVQDEAYALANAALSRFKRIDVWINCAPPVSARSDSVAASSSIDVAAELESYEHGANAALACFEKLGRGVLINVDATSSNMTAGSRLQRDARRLVCDAFKRIEVRARAVPGVRVTSVQCPRHTVASEALTPLIASLAHSLMKPGLVGRVLGALERERFRVLVRTVPHHRRRARPILMARDASDDDASRRMTNVAQGIAHDDLHDDMHDDMHDDLHDNANESVQDTHEVAQGAAHHDLVSAGSAHAHTVRETSSHRSRSDEAGYRKVEREDTAHLIARAVSERPRRKRGSWKVASTRKRRENMSTAALLLGVPAALAAILVLLVR